MTEEPWPNVPPVSFAAYLGVPRAPFPIEWQPIRDLPPECFDGRKVLFWWGDEAVTASYYPTRREWRIAWCEQGAVSLLEFAYFAEITPPPCPAP